MPFTFSHPAVVLPFLSTKSKTLSLTGLVIGSIVPDVEFLLRLRETACFGHTWLGIIAFDIPFAILLSFVFHLLIRDTLILHLPEFFRRRFLMFVTFNWKNYFNQNKIKVFISVIIGILSHVILDAFTHYDGAVAMMHPFFFSQFVIMDHRFFMYFILQVVSSLLGGVYILFVIFKLKKGSDLPRVNNAFSYWLSLLMVAVCILMVRLVMDTTHQAFIDIFIACIGSFLYSLVIISLYYVKQTAVVIKDQSAALVNAE